jgi:hypothetical protein
MASYYYDTEFLEGTQKRWFGETKPTIDLISIGIVAEDGREYYAISKDFNLKEAWNRYDLKEVKCHAGDVILNDGVFRKDSNTVYIKKYWIRDNVLKPIFDELVFKDLSYYAQMFKRIHTWSTEANPKNHTFTYKNFKKLINTYGKTNKQIAKEIKIFVANRGDNKDEEWILEYEYNKDKPKFYGYYSAYDHVALCWLFGKMIDLPSGFPMYTIDLKQEMDRIVSKSWKDVEMSTWGHTGIEDIKKHHNYPKQTNEHSAIHDARWNKQLHNFIKSL